MAEWLNSLKLRLRRVLRWRQMEQDFEDEMSFHLAMREEKLREAGVDDARFAARRRFGNVTRLKEDVREAWTFAALERLWADVRIGTRLILKNRWAMLTVIVSLSLGIGSTAAVFNLFDSFVLRSFPVPETHRVVRITAVSQQSSIQYLFSNPDFEDLRDRARSFDGVISVAADQLPRISTLPGQQARAALVSPVSAEFFTTLRVEPVVGRGFRREEDQVPGRDAVAVISDGLWRREYGGNPAVIGQTIRINSRDFTIVGVAPRNFPGIDPVARPEVYVPRVMEGIFGNEAVLSDRTIRRVQVLARLKPEVGIEQARDEVGRIGAQIAQDHPEANRGQQMTVYSQLGLKMAVSPEIFVIAGLFFAIAGLVLGIACVNVANLLLSMAPARTREMAIRVAMGASRSRLVRQMLIEGILVSVGGTLAGLGVAALSASFITSIEIFANLPISLDVKVDTRVALFAFAVGITAGTLSALVPALKCSRSNLNSLMKPATGSVRPGRLRVRQTLVVAQVAIAVLVLVLSGFAVEQLRLLRNANPGFRVDNTLRASFSAAARNEPSYRRSLERIRGIPGVRAAAMAYPEPMGVGTEATNVIVDGYTMPPGQPSLPIATAAVSEGYFETLDIPLVRGRAFEVRDMGETLTVAIINEVMANKYWANRDPLGSRIRTAGASFAGNHGSTLEIVGIARTAKYEGMSEEPMPFLYLPMKQSWANYGTLFVFTSEDPASFIPVFRRELLSLGSVEAIYDIGTMSQHVHQALMMERVLVQVMTAVGIIGLSLSVLGLYGIVAYSVSRRTHEIGIRIALGATSGGVLRLVLFQGLKLSAIGIVLGTIASRLMGSFLDVFFTSPGSGPDAARLPVYAAVIALSLVVTAFACYMPARRASMVDPNVALRCE